MTLLLVAMSLAALVMTYWAFSTDPLVPWWAAPIASTAVFALIVAAMVTAPKPSPAPEPSPVVAGVTSRTEGVAP